MIELVGDPMWQVPAVLRFYIAMALLLVAVVEWRRA